VLIITFLGAYIFYQIKNNNKKIIIKKNKYKQLKEYLTKNIDERSLQKSFTESGIKISALQYQFVRYGLTLALLIYVISTYWFKGGGIPERQLIGILGMFILSAPKEKFMNRRTPFKFLIDTLKENHRGKQNIEIYRSISQLKNIAISKQNNPPSSDFVLEQLRKFTSVVRPEFNRMSYLFNEGKKEEACDYFSSAIGTKEAEQLANLLSKLDLLNPFELRHQIEVYQEGMKKERETRKKKHNEFKSNLIYFVVIASCSLVLLNFVIVAYYIDVMNLMKYM
jgi:hypothetical protein